MRVLFVGNSFPTNKETYAGIYAKKQLEELRKQNPEDVFEICTIYGRHSNFIDKIFNYLKLFLKMLMRCFKKYEVVHVNIPFPTLLFALPYLVFHPTTKLILAFRGSDINCYPRHLLDKILGRVGYYLNDYVITVSKDLKEQYIQKIGDTESISIIPTGVDCDIFCPQNLKIKYDLVYVGSFVEYKGVNILLEALQGLDLRVLFIGQGPLEQIIESNGYLIKKNLEPATVSKFISESKFLVLPSFNEGTPNVVLEAFSTETPVIGSDIPGIENLVKHKKTGLLFEKGNEYRLHEILRGIQSKQIKATDFDKKEMTRIAQQFSLENSAKKLYNVFEKVCKS